MNDVLLHTTSQIGADFFLQTHSTNPLLSVSPSALTFTSTWVILNVVSNGTAVISAWFSGDLPGEFLSASTGPLHDSHFSQQWTFTRASPISCPATGALSVVTTYSNALTGSFGAGTFDAALAQTISDDCGVISGCELLWAVHGSPL